MSVPDAIKQTRFKEWVEIGIVAIVAMIWVINTLNDRKQDTAVTSKDVIELAKVMDTFAVTLHDIDTHGTRHSVNAILENSKDIAENRRRIEVIEKNYTSLYEILLEVKGRIGQLVPGHK